MTNYELVSKFAEMIRKKCKSDIDVVSTSRAFGMMTGYFDTLVDRFPEVRAFIEQKIKEEAE